MRHDSATVLLYRIVGQAELDLIAASDWLEFPLQQPEQVVFYLSPPASIPSPIAIGPGYLLRLTVDADYAVHFEAPWPAGQAPAELCVPATELAGLNRQIVGRIEVRGLLWAEK